MQNVGHTEQLVVLFGVAPCTARYMLCNTLSVGCVTQSQALCCVTLVNCMTYCACACVRAHAHVCLCVCVCVCVFVYAYACALMCVLIHTV